MRWSLWDLVAVIMMTMMSTLEVRAEDTHFIRGPKNRTALLDQNFRYHCKVAGDENYKISWFHNNTKVITGARNFRITKNGTLRISKVKVVHRGFYYCKVRNRRLKQNIFSPKGYLTVHAPAEIFEKHKVFKLRERFVGSEYNIKCEAVGIPSPVVEWRRNGHLIVKNQSNPIEVLSERFKKVLLTSTLRIIVSQSANYTCRAFNFPIGKLANDSITIAIKGVELPETNIQTEMVEGPSKNEICAPYGGFTCKDYLENHLVVYKHDPSQDKIDLALVAQLEDVTSLGLFSNFVAGRSCEGATRRLLCHVAYPACHNKTKQAVPFCQESCQAIKSSNCFKHRLAELEALRLAVKVSHDIDLLSLPDCLTLPSKWNSSHTCIELNHSDFAPELVQDDCYVEKGHWYNGTVNVTKSGHMCQAWLEHIPHKHDHSPMAFPELVDAVNFCRNPGGEKGQPWCYTTNVEMRWEICDISPCDLGRDLHNLTSHTNDQAGERDREDGDDDLSLLYVIGACALVTVSFVVGILCFLLRHRQHAGYGGTLHELEVKVEDLPLNSAYHQMKSIRLNPKLERLEVPRNNIVFAEDIGHGAFGPVFKARIVCSNRLSHLTWARLRGRTHSPTSDKKSQHVNLFSSLGSLASGDIHTSSKICDSKLLGEQEISKFCDHDNDMPSMQGQIIVIKMLMEDASDVVQADFEREASLLVEFDHVNIIRLLGVCTVGRPMCMLLEYMCKGDLNEYLRLCSPDQLFRQNLSGSCPSLIDPISCLDQLHMARQVANGMIYLSDKGYVHRDLATRNCLVDNNLTVKISDFGLTRNVHSMDYYEGSDMDAVPVRWMSPEAILYNKFSFESDVWSFGVLLWEIFSFAAQPYSGMSHEEVINYLRGGNILDAPDRGSSAVYELMKQCWHRQPQSRPNFSNLHTSLNVMYMETSRSFNVINKETS